MEKRTLGKSGLEVSAIGLGTWQLGGDFGINGVENAQHILTAADQAGINFWDTADVYGDGISETSIGTWKRKHRKNKIVATKVGRNAAIYPDNYKYSALLENIERSLTRLQVDSLDLLQLHCIPKPVLEKDDIWLTLEDFRKQGFIKHYGASVETIEEGLLCINKPGLTSLQVIFNLFRQDLVSTLLPEAEKNDVGIIVRLPLASGALSGKYSLNTEFSAQDHRNYNKNGELFSVGETFSGIPYAKLISLVDELKAFMPEDMSLAQFALRWILDHPQISSVIAGASSAEQVKENASVNMLPSLHENTHQLLSDFYYSKVKQHIRGKV